MSAPPPPPPPPPPAGGGIKTKKIPASSSESSSSNNSSSKLPPISKEKGDLMAEIRKGKPLKKVPDSQKKLPKPVQEAGKGGSSASGQVISAPSDTGSGRGFNPFAGSGGSILDELRQKQQKLKAGAPTSVTLPQKTPSATETKTNTSPPSLTSNEKRKEIPNNLGPSKNTPRSSDTPPSMQKKFEFSNEKNTKPSSAAEKSIEKKEIKKSQQSPPKLSLPQQKAPPLASQASSRQHNIVTTEDPKKNESTNKVSSSQKQTIMSKPDPPKAPITLQEKTVQANNSSIKVEKTPIPPAAAISGAQKHSITSHSAGITDKEQDTKKKTPTKLPPQRESAPPIPSKISSSLVESKNKELKVKAEMTSSSPKSSSPPPKVSSLSATRNASPPSMQESKQVNREKTPTSARVPSPSSNSSVSKSLETSTPRKTTTATATTPTPRKTTTATTTTTSTPTTPTTSTTISTTTSTPRKTTTATTPTTTTKIQTRIGSESNSSKLPKSTSNNGNVSNQTPKASSPIKSSSPSKTTVYFFVSNIPSSVQHPFEIVIDNNVVYRDISGENAKLKEIGIEVPEPKIAKKHILHTRIKIPMKGVDEAENFNLTDGGKYILITRQPTLKIVQRQDKNFGTLTTVKTTTTTPTWRGGFTVDPRTGEKKYTQSTTVTQRKSEVQKPAQQSGEKPATHSRTLSKDLDTVKMLASLRDKGILTEEEFQAKKKQILQL